MCIYCYNNVITFHFSSKRNVWMNKVCPFLKKIFTEEKRKKKPVQHIINFVCSENISLRSLLLFIVFENFKQHTNKDILHFKIEYVMYVCNMMKSCIVLYQNLFPWNYTSEWTEQWETCNLRIFCFQQNTPRKAKRIRKN